jgi:hypothetical protein
MHILCPMFGYYVKHEKSLPSFYASNVSITPFFILFLLLNISCHNVRKNKSEGIAYNGPIML